MNRGFYTAASGGIVNARRVEIVSNNLANVNTVGYKAQRISTRQQEFRDTLASRIGDTLERARFDQERTPGAVQARSTTDFSVGPINKTGNPLNVALRKENAFFVIETADGEAYTRAGNFTLNAEGQLVTQDGLPVAGDGGAITVAGGGTNVRIAGTGNVLVDGESAGRLRVVEIDNLGALERTEGTRFKLSQGARARNIEADVVPESVEMPNISVVEAMVSLIDAQRAFEAYTKTVQTLDQLNSQAIRNSRAS